MGSAAMCQSGSMLRSATLGSVTFWRVFALAAVGLPLGWVLLTTIVQQVAAR